MSQIKARQLPIQKNTRFEQVFHRNHRACDCAMPMVSRKWNDALGTFVAVRLCCMARAVERIAAAVGVDVGDLYEVFDFDPRWVWDCAELHQGEAQDGTVEFRERGAPPDWLRQRLEAKGIPILNLAGRE